MPPNASQASVATPLGGVEVAEVGHPHLRVGPAVGEDLLEAVLATRDDADAVAALGEQSRGGGADTRGRSGDEDIHAA